MMENKLFELKNVTKKFNDDTIAVDQVSFVIKPGITVLIGPSGSGKSTMLRLLNLLEKPNKGDILYLEESILSKSFDLSGYRQKVNMVFQHFNLFNHLTVLENLNLAQIEVLKKSKDEATKTALRYLEKVGLSDKKDQYPNKLSGGQKQRVAIARSLCMEPKVILFDEPTSALDPEMIKEVLTVMVQLAAQGVNMVIVTHEMNFAKAFATEVLVVDQGKIIERGNPDEIFNRAKHERTKQFLDNLTLDFK